LVSLELLGLLFVHLQFFTHFFHSEQRSHTASAHHHAAAHHPEAATHSAARTTRSSAAGTTAASLWSLSATLPKRKGSRSTNDAADKEKS
jgi:hypothetical protein